MINLSDFKPVEVGSGPCAITLTLNSIIFSRGLMEKLTKPDFVKILIDEDKKLLVILKTDKSDPYAVDINRIPIRGRVNSRDFVKKIKLMCGFTDTDTIRIPGKFIPEDNLILIDLSQSIKIDSLNVD